MRRFVKAAVVWMTVILLVIDPASAGWWRSRCCRPCYQPCYQRCYQPSYQTCNQSCPSSQGTCGTSCGEAQSYTYTVPFQTYQLGPGVTPPAEQNPAPAPGPSETVPAPTPAPQPGTKPDDAGDMEGLFDDADSGADNGAPASNAAVEVAETPTSPMGDTVVDDTAIDDAKAEGDAAVAPAAEEPVEIDFSEPDVADAPLAQPEAEPAPDETVTEPAADMSLDEAMAEPAADEEAPAVPPPGVDESLDDLMAEPAAEDDASPVSEEATSGESTPDDAPAEETPADGSAKIDVTAEEPQVAADAMRTWTDNTGKFQVRARLVSVRDGKVRLLKENGHYTTVPFGRLSGADLAFAQRQAPSLVQAGPERKAGAAF